MIERWRVIVIAWSLAATGIIIGYVGVLAFQMPLTRAVPLGLYWSMQTIIGLSVLAAFIGALWYIATSRQGGSGPMTPAG